MSTVGVRISFVVAILLVAIGLVSLRTVLAEPHLAGIGAPQPLSIGAQVTPDPAGTLETVTFATRFQAPSQISEPLQAQLEVRSVASGATVLTMIQSGFQVPAGGARSIYWEWRVPGRVDPGQYSVDVKVVGANSGALYGEEQKAATFQVGATGN